jgi:L-fucose mutarotase/ribose pyranase (RbsD/FucU family)
MRRRVRRTQDPRIAGTATIACDSGGPRVARLDGIPATDVLEAVLSVLPLERKGPQGCSRMIANGPPQSDLREPDARSKSIGMS